MINRKNIIEVNYDMKMSDELLSYINKNVKFFEHVPSVYIYYKILLTLRESDVHQHFNDLKHSLDKHAKEFSKGEALQMYLYAQNFCIKKVNSGKEEYLKEIFSIYESLLTNELIFENGQLSQWDYKNIVTTAIKLEKFDWTKNFIEKYKNFIAAEFRQNAYEYNLAYYYYNRQNYKSALKLLQMVDFTDVYYHLGAKTMLLKMYFELNEVESFYSLIDAYKVYLVRNKKISVYQRKSYQDLIRYSKQAFDLKLKNTSLSPSARTNAIKKLKNNIAVGKNDANLVWLRKMIEQF